MMAANENSANTFPRKSYYRVASPNPHLARMKEILKKHPHLKSLSGFYRPTALYALLLVSIQLGLAVGLSQTPWWILLPASYLIGATINHALFVILHECTHNVVFKKPLNNRLLGLFVNFPQFFPSAMQFFKYHMLHHTHQSEYDFDADIAEQKEADWIGNSRWKKALALFFFSFVQGSVRPHRLKKVRFWDGWFVFNIFTQFSFLLIFYSLAGGWALVYLFLSTLFALGLHPLGGRWIQEHYVVKQNQETNSYYGPLNKLCFNMGYHNEHHDFMRVPWKYLPEVKRQAPEFYNDLFAYQSWTYCLKRFIWDKNMSFFDRYVRFERPPTA